ncbi:MAG: CPBP family intramembrane metalloprotease [Firmicutes bacterium]|nr:CPBP family intramembrane metalloprotease [Bacillota bacterium]
MKESYAYKPVQFFFIANLITWAAWLIAAYFSYQQGGGSNGLISILELVGLFGPFGAALLMIFTSNSTELKQNFYDRLLNLKLIKLSSIPAIFFIIPAAVVISVLISYLFFGQSLDQLTIAKAAPFTAGLIPIPLMLFGAALIEELGWKGYGVDSLRGKRTFFTATLIYAALWALWHIPLFFINNYYHNILIKTNPLFALNFIVSVFPAAFIINWLWYKNNGNIITAVLFHAAANFQGVLQMGQVAKCIETIVLIVIAIIIVSLNKKIFFEKFPAQIGYFGQDASG